MDLQEHELDSVLWVAETKQTQKGGPPKELCTKENNMLIISPCRKQLGIWSVWVEYLYKPNRIGTMQQNLEMN